MFDHTLVAPAGATTWSGSPFDTSNPVCPNLDFAEQCIINFVDALDALVPIKSRIAAVIGGSLGGSMGLRLAAPDLDPSQSNRMWPQNVVAWSPASAGGSWAHNMAFKGPLNDLAGITTGKPAQQQETPGSRDAFFTDVYVNPMGIPGDNSTQPQSWWRKGWPCASTSTQNSLADREETYNASFRRWHYRQNLEQVLFSQYNTDTPKRQTRCSFIKIRLLLAAGELDTVGDVTGKAGIAEFSIGTTTRKLMEYMAANNIVPNSAGIIFKGIGHSIHDESPALLAQQIVSFLPSDHVVVIQKSMTVTVQKTNTSVAVTVTDSDTGKAISGAVVTIGIGDNAKSTSKGTTGASGMANLRYQRCRELHT
jgi:pimeloyl-ACP methyl ester carboxylesterase